MMCFCYCSRMFRVPGRCLDCLKCLNVEVMFMKRKTLEKMARKRGGEGHSPTSFSVAEARRPPSFHSRHTRDTQNHEEQHAIVKRSELELRGVALTRFNLCYVFDYSVRSWDR